MTQLAHRHDVSARETVAAARLAPAPWRSVSILGATGSVGRATLDLIATARDQHGPDAFPIIAMTANGNWRELAKLASAFRPQRAVVADETGYAPLKEALAGCGVEVAAGADAVCEAARMPAQWIMSAIVGAAGLAPTLAAAEGGGAIALANKESLVCAGETVMGAIAKVGGVCLPVDSEHNAIFQVLGGASANHVEQLTLTASGGPFRTLSLELMTDVTPEQACAHPNWSMGAKISVDSATMMNKGLELIEALHVFGVAPSQLEAVVHPQSVVHSLVSFTDGSVLAQLGAPDMRIPIAYTLSWPERMITPSPRLNLTEIKALTFERPDLDRFQCLALARDAMSLGERACAALNAANEVAVARFLDRRLGFLDISKVVSQTLELAQRAFPLSGGAENLDEILTIDAYARRLAGEAADEIGR